MHFQISVPNIYETIAFTGIPTLLTSHFMINTIINYFFSNLQSIAYEMHVPGIHKY
jgi:hypothetical protein